MGAESWVLFVTIVTGGVDLQEGKYQTVESCMLEGIEKVRGNKDFGFACVDQGESGICVEITRGELQVCENAKPIGDVKS